MNDEINKMLNDHFISNHPNVPDYARPKAKTGQSPANKLTNTIIKHITLGGGWATRINTMGRIVDGKYIPGSTKLGTFDIIGCWKGKFIGIEVKIGKDKMSEAQIKVHSDVIKAGGIAWVCHNVDEYLTLFKSLECT